MESYTLKLIANGWKYNLYKNGTLVSDSDLAALFATAGTGYFAIDANGHTITTRARLTIKNSQDQTVIENVNSIDIIDGVEYKGTWNNDASRFASFARPTAKGLTTDQLSFLMHQIKSGGGGGAITYLSQDDYNWNYNTLTTTEPNAIALWLLEPGLYALRSNDPSSNVMYVSNNTGGGAEGSNDTFYIVTSFPFYNGTYGDGEIKTVTSLRAYSMAQYVYDYNDTVEDGWSQTGEDLFASMSMVHGEISAVIQRDSYAPTVDDMGQVGGMWVMTDPSDHQVAKLYICTNSYWDGAQGKVVNTWVEVASHSS